MVEGVWVGVGTEGRHEGAAGAAHGTVHAEHDGLVGRVTRTFEPKEPVDHHDLQGMARAARAAHDVAAGLKEGTGVPLGLEGDDGLGDGVGSVGRHCS
jgi:hypothetical protein